MNEKVGQILGLKAEFLEEVEDLKMRISWGHCLSARICIDISSPLKKGCWLSTSDGCRIWINFCYEKLHDYCYICGVLIIMTRTVIVNWNASMNVLRLWCLASRRDLFDT